MNRPVEVAGSLDTHPVRVCARRVASIGWPMVPTSIIVSFAL